jgi:ribosomal protein L11 methyltransferase
VKRYPALDVQPGASPDALLGLLDDFQPTALDDHDSTWRVFFAASDTRDRARDALATAGYSPAAVEVDDEDWAARSQQALGPVVVGRVTIAPPWAIHSLPQSPASGLQPLLVVIEPSMGFGTGHHATTRLCLAAIQTIDVTGCRVLDVGTGSGVLAIASGLLGAAHAVGIDSDPDALDSARANLALNPAALNVEFQLAEVMSAKLPRADVLTANLTGTLLQRAAAVLLQTIEPGGRIIVSGVLAAERAAVVEAFTPAALEWEAREDEWVAIVFRRAGYNIDAEATASA